MADCPVTGKVFQVTGGEISRYRKSARGATITGDQPWTLADMIDRVPQMLIEEGQGAIEAWRKELAAALKSGGSAICC